MFRYKVTVKKGKGDINESFNCGKKSITIKSKTPKTAERLFDEAASYFKKKYNFILESADINSDDKIRVYVGTWSKYANGIIDGEWVDLSKFKTPNEFKRYCHKKIHADEGGNAELMFQDVEGPEWFRSLVNEYGMNSDVIWGCLALDDYEKSVVEGYIEVYGVSGFDDFAELVETAKDSYVGGEGQSFDDWCKDYFEEMFGFMSVNPSRGGYGRSEEGFISKYPYYIDVENAKLYMDNDGWGYNEETDEYDEISDEDAMDWIRDGGGDRRIETVQDLIDNSLIDWELIERDWRIEYSVASNGCVYR
jgi:hypothetical protein